MASHLVLDWEWPPSVAVRRELSSFCGLICFDKRGTGLSDAVLAVATLEERTEDIRAVMAVHTAARVAALAQADEILVTQTIPDLVAGSGLAFHDRGQHDFKGVGPRHIYAATC